MARWVDNSGNVRLEGEIENGGSQPGGASVTPIPVTYDMAGLNNGVVVYTAVADILLLNAWLSITTAWDGISPLGDLGGVTGGASPGDGLFGQANMALENPELGSATGLVGTAPAMAYNTNSNIAILSVGDSLYFWVSQDGSKGGADPGAMKGEGVLYLLLATPPAP